MALFALVPSPSVSVHTPAEAVRLASALMRDGSQEWAVLLLQADAWKVGSVLLLQHGTCQSTLLSAPAVRQSVDNAEPLRVWLIRSHDHPWEGFSLPGLQRFRAFRLLAAQHGLTLHDVCVVDTTRRVCSLRAWGQAPASMVGESNGSGDAARISWLSRMAAKTILAASCSHIIFSAF